MKPLTATTSHKRQRKSAGWHLQHSYLDTYGTIPVDLATNWIPMAQFQ